MKRQVAKVVCNGIYTVIYDDKEKVNPFRIYRDWWEDGHHHKQMNRYADFYSCMIYLSEIVRENNWEG